LTKLAVNDDGDIRSATPLPSEFAVRVSRSGFAF
jgi:hypothetical protein